MSNTKPRNNEPKPTKESFMEICRVLNQSRPYSSSDSIKQHFIPNFAETPEQAALYRACNESFIKTY